MPVICAHASHNSQIHSSPVSKLLFWCFAPSVSFPLFWLMRCSHAIFSPLFSFFFHSLFLLCFSAAAVQEVLSLCIFFVRCFAVALLFYYYFFLLLLFRFGWLLFFWSVNYLIFYSYITMDLWKRAEMLRSSREVKLVCSKLCCAGLLVFALVTWEGCVSGLSHGIENCIVQGPCRVYSRTPTGPPSLKPRCPLTSVTITSL